MINLNDVDMNIVIKTQFEAMHRWPDCPFIEVEFLRNTHRHIFHVVVKWPVTHTDRDTEFIMAKRNIDFFILKEWAGRNIGTMSCEDLAARLMEEFDADFVSVFEDDENGAEIKRKVK